MRVWLITVGEPLPIDGPNERLLRAGLMARELHRRGHEVCWWSATMDHIRKRLRADRTTSLLTTEGYRLTLLHGPAYTRNISLRRIANHQAMARAFSRLAPAEPRPDVIVCSLPTLELCDEATRYGASNGVPVVIDIRDLWPDQFLDLAPRCAAPAARLALAPMFRQAARACRNASALTAITDEYLSWGLNIAGRPRTELDRVFAMGYSAGRPDEASIARANRFWDDHGLGTNGHGDPFLVCFFGTIGRHFEIDVVLHAARRLATSHPAIRFVLCGQGDMLEHHRRQAADLSNVLLPGWVGRAEIWTLMRRAAAGLAPYRSVENFVGNVPNKPIEYFSAGLPVISSLTGALRELLDRHDCGLSYPNGDPAALASALATLHDQPEHRRAMSRNAESLFRERFVAETIYGHFSTFLEELASSSNPSVAAEATTGTRRLDPRPMTRRSIDAIAPDGGSTPSPAPRTRELT